MNEYGFRERQKLILCLEEFPSIKISLHYYANLADEKVKSGICQLADIPNTMDISVPLLMALRNYAPDYHWFCCNVSKIESDDKFPMGKKILCARRIESHELLSPQEN